MPHPTPTPARAHFPTPAHFSLRISIQPIRPRWHPAGGTGSWFPTSLTMCAAMMFTLPRPRPALARKFISHLKTRLQEIARRSLAAGSRPLRYREQDAGIRRSLSPHITGLIDHPGCSRRLRRAPFSPGLRPRTTPFPFPGAPAHTSPYFLVLAFALEQMPGW